MMKLSTMKKVLKTVDSEWRSPLAEQILSRWGYDQGSVFYLRASANFIFIFKKDGRTYYLRFNESCEREHHAIEAEINIILYLGNNSLNVAQPVKSLNEKYLEVVETGIGTYYAVVFEALEGDQYEIEEITTEQNYLWGKSLGKLHKCLKNIPEQYYVYRSDWKDHLLKVKETLPSHETAAHRELERISKWADSLKVTKENFGLIHYDFELDNVVFNNYLIGMLDFDDCSSYWYVADIIYALRDVGDFSMNSPIVIKFIEGYKTETTIDIDLLKESSGYERLHKLVSFAKLIRTVDIEESQENPEWLTNLRKKLCHKINEYRLSFEENS